MSPVTLEAMISIPSEVVFQKVGEETVFLNLRTGFYYGLDSIGSRIWEVLARDGEPTVGQALHAMIEEFDAPPDQMQADLIHLMEQLQEKGLVTVVS